MAIFQYKGRNKAGQLVSGELQGTNAAAIRMALVRQGVIPINVSTKGMGRAIKDFFKFRIKIKELVNFTRQFHLLIRCGTPMNRALAALENQGKNEGLKETLSKIRLDISAGLSLADAFRKHSRIFNSLYVGMVGVGETAGILDQVLEELGRILKLEADFKDKVKSATFYPKMAGTIVLLIGIGLLTFAVPEITKQFAGQEDKLPGITVMVMGASDLILHYWWAILIGLGLGFYGWIKIADNDQVKEARSVFQLKIPVVNKLLILTNNARFCHLLGALLRAGVPLAQSLTVLMETMDNYLFKRDVQILKERLEKGGSLTEALEHTHYFTPMVRESVSTGEETGHLDEMLASVAGFYDEEADHLLDNLSKLIEPMMIMVIAGMVLTIMLACLLPIWTMSSTI